MDRNEDYRSNMEKEKKKRHTMKWHLMSLLKVCYAIYGVLLRG